MFRNAGAAEFVPAWSNCEETGYIGGHQGLYSKKDLFTHRSAMHWCPRHALPRPAPIPHLRVTSFKISPHVYQLININVSFHRLYLLSPETTDTLGRHRYAERMQDESTPRFQIAQQIAATDTTDTVFRGTPANKRNYRNCSLRSGLLVSCSNAAYYHGSVGVTTR
jgi:hypothetical protein